jgi:hypothetical protein
MKTDTRRFKYARDVIWVAPKSCFGNYLETKYFYSLEDAKKFAEDFNDVPEAKVGKLILLEPYEIFS